MGFLHGRAACAAGIFSIVLTQTVLAQQQVETQQRMDRMEAALREMDAKYQAELKKRDDEIADLKSRLSTMRPADTVPTTGPSAEDVHRARAMDQLTDDILQDLETRKKDDPMARVAAVMNPDIAVVVDFLANVSSRNVDATRNRVDVREAELDLRAAVDPRADAVMVLAFARDAAPALFGAEDIGEIDTSVELEEAYLFLHDFGIPNLTARIGKYHLRFGRQNMLHLHDLPTSDPAFVNQSFLAPEALTDAGMELSFLVPNPWNEYFELIASLNSGEGGGSESPTLRGDSRAQSPSITSHFLWNKNITPTTNAELGASVLWGPSENDDPAYEGTRRDVWLYGLDFTLVNRDPTGGFNNQLIQSEFIYGHTRQEDGTMSNSWGAYLLGQQQLSKDWYAGVRLDWTQDANNASNEIFGVSPYVSWYLSEFLRFRAEYQYRGGDVPGENLLFFQVTWIYGAHPPHPYWSMK